MTLDSAIEVFARAYSSTRGIASPSVAARIGPDIWVVRDDPPDRRAARSEEYIGCGVSGAALDGAARRDAQGGYRICAIARDADSDSALRAEFRALGYRLNGTEPLMVHDLGCLPAPPESLPVARIATPEQAAALAQATRRRPLSPSLLDGDPPLLRQYAAFDSGRAVGWVGSIAACGSAWVTSLFVAPEYRRRGIAKALLARMLRDDFASGANASVLLASHAGAKLYPTVGYTAIGTLLVYSPRRRREG